MKTSELIRQLEVSLEQNGDLDVIGVANGVIYPYIDINLDNDSPLYIELAE